MLCFVMDQDSTDSGGLQESHQLTDSQSYADIAAMLQPKDRPNGHLPRSRLVDFFVRGSRPLQVHLLQPAQLPTSGLYMCWCCLARLELPLC